MDVKEIDSGTLSAMAGKKGKREELDGPDFQKLLQEAQSNWKPGQAGNSPEGSVGRDEFWVNSLSPIPSVELRPGLQETSILRSQGTQATERALDLLEQYQKAMADPQVSLKQVNPLIQALSQEVKGFAQWAENLPSSDPLREILTEIGALSSVEIERFNRGDYI